MSRCRFESEPRHVAERRSLRRRCRTSGTDVEHSTPISRRASAPAGDECVRTVESSVASKSIFSWPTPSKNEMGVADWNAARNGGFST